MKNGGIYSLLLKEKIRQNETLDLIPSENIVSKNVLKILGSELTNKYAEGKSHQRYYFGNKVVDDIEDRVKSLVYKAFNASSKTYGINVQPYSGSIANLASYLGALKLGDKILSMSLEHGGHLSHGHNVSWTGKLFKFSYYGVGRDGLIDYEKIQAVAKKLKPKLIICGASAYPRIINFKKFREIADSVNALLLADIAHIAGLIIAGVHPSPFPYADIITTTTQKTLRGPRGAIIIAKKELMEKIDKSIFPGLQGGPHVHSIAAIGAALEETMRPSFKKYIRQVVKNAKILSAELSKFKFSIVSGGTDNHLLLIDVTPFGWNGKDAGRMLEKAGIVVNKNMIPYDTRNPFSPSGIRLGTPSVTSRGMKEGEMQKIAVFIKQVLIDRVSPLKVKLVVKKLAKQFPLGKF